MSEAKIVRRLSWRAWTAWAIIGLVWAGTTLRADAPPPPALPPVMDLVPLRSQMVVLVPSLSGFSQKLAVLSEAVGLTIPEMNDVLGEIKRATGMSTGIKNDGSAALVASSLNAPPDQSPPMVLLIPVVDYEGFVTALKGKASDPIAQLTFALGHQAYAKRVEGFAVLSSREELVEGFKPEHASAQWVQRIDKAGMDCIMRSDVSVFMDMSNAEPFMRGRIAGITGLFQPWIERVTGKGPLGQVLTKALVNMYRDSAAAEIRDSSTTVMGLDLDELGIGVTGVAQVKQDSAMAKLLGSVGAADRQLERLPSQPNLMTASAADFRTLKLPTLLANLQDELTQQQLGSLADVLKGAKPLIDLTTGVGQVWCPSPGGVSAAPAVGLSVITTDDPKGFVEAFKNWLMQLNNVKADLSNLAVPASDPSAPAPVATFTNKFNANAMQLEGVSVDQYELQCNIPLSVVSQLGSGGAMSVLGMMNQRGYLVATDRAVIWTTSLDRQMLVSALAASKGVGALDANQNITQVRQHLTAMPSVVMFWNVSSITQTISNIASTVNSGLPLTLQIPKDLPPVGWSMSIQGPTETKRLFIPMPVLKFAHDAISAIMWPAPTPLPGTPGAPGTPGFPR